MSSRHVRCREATRRPRRCTFVVQGKTGRRRNVYRTSTRNRGKNTHKQVAQDYELPLAKRNLRGYIRVVYLDSRLRTCRNWKVTTEHKWMPFLRRKSCGPGRSHTTTSSLNNRQPHPGNIFFHFFVSSRDSIIVPTFPGYKLPPYPHFSAFLRLILYHSCNINMTRRALHFTGCRQHATLQLKTDRRHGTCNRQRPARLTSPGSSSPTLSIPDATRLLSPLASHESHPGTASGSPSPVRMSKGSSGGLQMMP